MKLLLILFCVSSFCYCDKRDIAETNAPNTNSCQRKSELTDSNGKYLKSVCQTYDELSYSEAIEKCLENGMKLFIINDSTTQAALYKFADSVWPKYFGAALWVNGKKDINSGNWYINNNGSKEPLFGNIRRWSTEYSYGELCLRTSNLRGDFSVDNFDCNERMTSFCEFEGRITETDTYNKEAAEFVGENYDSDEYTYDEDTKFYDESTQDYLIKGNAEKVTESIIEAVTAKIIEESIKTDAESTTEYTTDSIDSNTDDNIELNTDAIMMDTDENFEKDKIDKSMEDDKYKNIEGTELIHHVSSSRINLILVLCGTLALLCVCVLACWSRRFCKQ